MILHGVEIIDRSTHKRHPELQVMRMAVPGGWLYITHVCAPSDARREDHWICLLYTSPSPRDRTRSRMPSSA